MIHDNMPTPHLLRLAHLHGLCACELLQALAPVVQPAFAPHAKQLSTCK